MTSWPTPVFGAFQFGFEMGSGARTYVTATAPYVVAVGVLLAGSVAASLAAGIGFGAGRAATAIGYGLSKHARWNALVEGWIRTVKFGGAAAAAAIVVTLLAL